MKECLKAIIHGVSTGFVLFLFDVSIELCQTASVIITSMHLQDYYKS